MSTIRKILFSVPVCLVLSACSSTISDVNQVIENIDRSSIQGVQLEISGENIQRTSQTSSHIFTLHHTPKELKYIAGLVAKRYGFIVVEERNDSNFEGSTTIEISSELAERDNMNSGFHMNLLSAMPDGGECLEGLAATTSNLSFTGSVLTLGIAPASTEHCLIVEAELYRYEDSQRVLVGEFSANLGRVELYAGANEIDNYQLNVDKRDELRSLEVSFGSLLNTMLAEGAFEQKPVGEFSF